MRANLADRGCRHLMLLTHHGAALPLLFDAGLLHEGQARHPRHHMYVCHLQMTSLARNFSPAHAPSQANHLPRTSLLRLQPSRTFCVSARHLLS